MEQATERSAIETVLLAYEEALNTSDINKVLVLYAQDGIFMPTTFPTASGLAELEMAYTNVFKAIQLNIRFVIEEVIISGDIAFARTFSKGTALIHSTGQTITEENREFFLLRKEAAGWRIYRYMFNKAK
jgi:uncharacterized protein (TIGR02246 family)